MMLALWLLDRVDHGDASTPLAVFLLNDRLGRRNDDLLVSLVGFIVDGVFIISTVFRGLTILEIRTGHDLDCLVAIDRYDHF
ncbi:MAG: hypothetical protein U0271_25475 [Polyangiaceae bacterium]